MSKNRKTKCGGCILGYALLSIIMAVIAGVSIYFGYHAFEDDSWKFTKLFVSITMLFLFVVFVVTFIHLVHKRNVNRNCKKVNKNCNK